MLYFLLVFFVAIRTFIVFLELNAKIKVTNTLDLSWQTDTIERLLHGYVAGRDFIFTYGPLHQIIISIPSLIFGIPSFASLPISSICLTFLNGFIVISMAKELIDKKSNQVLLSIALLTFYAIIIIPDQNNVLRTTSPLLYSLLFLKYTNLTKLPNARTILTLFIPSLLGLYSFDLFILCVFISLAILLMKTIYIQTNTNLIEKIAMMVFYIFFIFFLEIIISYALSGNLSYILYSIDTVKSYQFIENIPFSRNPIFLLFIVPIALCIYLFILIKKSKLKAITKTKLVILTITCLLSLKSGLIRSDDSHIILAVFPSIIVFITILFLTLKNKKLFLFFFALLLISWPYKQTINHIQRISVPNINDFFSIYSLPNNYYLTHDDFKFLRKLIMENKNSVLVYPYDLFILNIYSTTFNTLPLQYYNYSNSLVEHDSVVKLNQNPPKFIILGIDNRGISTLDDIPNLTRNPILAKWMISNYKVFKIFDKYLVLIRSHSKDNSINGCPLFELKTSQLMEPNFTENLLKPATYYLGGHNFRLPYSYSKNDFFIIEKYDDPSVLIKIFNSNIDFKINSTSKQKVIIIKKFPIPIFYQQTENIVIFNCFNTK